MFLKFLPGIWLTSMDGLDDRIMATIPLESLQGMATV